MVNKYYLCDLGTAQNTRSSRVNELRSGLLTGPTRQEAKDQLHWAVSTDGRWVLANVEASDADHTWLLGRGYVTYQGDMTAAGYAPQATYDYIAANPTLWTRSP